MVSIAVALIVIAILLGVFGLFVEGAHLLLWVGIILLIAAVVVYLVNGSRRGGPPL